MNQKQTGKRMDAAGSLTPDLEGAPRSASHPRRPPSKPKSEAARKEETP